VTTLESRVVTAFLSPMLVTGTELVTTWRLLTVGGCHRLPGGLSPPSGRSVTGPLELCAFQALCPQLVTNSCLQGRGSTRYSTGGQRGFVTGSLSLKSLAVDLGSGRA
jgi:hypothetical protein